MNTKKFLLPVTALAAVLLLGACADGKSPKIKSFTASQTALPEGGAEVTFTWKVSGEKSLTLEPQPGVVTGTSATVVVTEPTVYTLTAKNGSKKDRKKISFTVGDAFNVLGQAVDYHGQPAPGATVFVDDQILVADEDGYFLVEDVIPPYDLGWFSTQNGGGPAFGGPGHIEIVMYAGVTRPDPVLLVNVYQSGTFAGYATVSGTMSGGAGFPYPTPTPDPNFGMSLEITGPGLSVGWTSVDSNTGDYSTYLSWHDANDTQPFVVGALQYRTVPDVTYTGFGRTEGLATLDDDLVGVNFALNPVTTDEITVTVDGGPSLDLSDVYLGGALNLGPTDPPRGSIGGGLPQIYAETYNLPEMYLSSAGEMALRVPGDVPGGTIGVNLYGYSNDGYGNIFRWGAAPGSSMIATFPALPYLLTPLDGGTITPQTVFSVAEVSDAVYANYFYASSGVPCFGIPCFGVPQPEIEITVFSNSPSIRFPDGLDFGGTPFEGRVFGWSASAICGFDGVDGMVRDGFLPEGEYLMYSGEYGERTLQYATRGPSMTF